jgi:hypothetical protein
VKRLTLFAAALISLLTAACGGGSGSNGNPPPPVGKFTNASLKGNYVFSMAGTDLNFSSIAGPGPIARVGSFIADGNGSITSAIEDVDDDGAINTAVAFSQGTYSIQANGKGTMTLPTASGDLVFSISLGQAAPAGKGFMIETDLQFATASGIFEQQDISSFSQPFATGTYVFDVSGSDTTGLPSSFVGAVATNGSTSVGAGIFDRHDAGISGDPSGPHSITAGGLIQLDQVNSANFGRGTITIAGLNFAFYPVDQTHLKLLEIDGQQLISGDIFEQTGAIATQNSAFTGSFVYSVGGSAFDNGFQTFLPIARAARFTADGGGHLNVTAVDQNNDGLATCIGSGCSSASTTGTYSIDTVNGNGRGMLNITFPGQTAGFTHVFYQISPTTAVIQDIDSSATTDVVADGTMFGQSGSFSNSSLAGNYVFNFTGQTITSSGNIGFEEDFVGQYALSGASSNNIFGVTDFVEPGSTSSRPPDFLNVPITGTLNISVDGTGRNGYQIVTGNSPGTNINFAAYFISPTQVLLISTQNTRVTVGTVSSQQVP